ncbi:SprT family zinc-dependent metalloprotease [Shewanella mesophila]|nr:SprT family zinc-dependent metalloprotease [Shewanella mesophila]
MIKGKASAQVIPPHVNRSAPPKTDNQAHILRSVESCYRLAEQQLNRSFPRPEVNFKLRGKSAGTAHLQLNKLRFNATLLEENAAEFVAQVVPHEICHLLAYQLYGRVKPHGKEWQSLMIKLYQLRPSTTHNLDISSVEGKTYGYRCDCGPVNLSVRRHNKILRQQTQYRCRRCSQTLTLAG